jgi:hypothetical protein
MRNDSSLNYNTPHSKVQNFKDFEADIQKEKDKLKQLKRNFKKNKDGGNNLANTDSDKLYYNKITHKTDKNIGKELVSDFLDDLEEKEETPKHKYKLDKEQDLTKMESYQDFIQKKNLIESDFSDDSNVTSYMFFGNLQTIHRLSSEILQMDQGRVNQTLDDGHNWAEDHVTTAKVQISQVFNFLTNKLEEPTNPMMKEDHQYNYMFFANLETITEQCEKMLSMDEKTVDSTLVNGHDWAEDHIASAKENIEQVHEFLQNELQG